MRSNQWVEETEPGLALASLDLASGSGDRGVRVERFPEMVQCLGPGLCANIEQDADVGVQGASKGVEKPSMRVELLRVGLFQTENHLTRHDALLSALELEVRIQRDLCCVFVDVGRDFALVDVVLGDTLLEASHGSNGVQRTRMDFAASVGDDADNNLLPAVFTPCARLHA